MRVYVSWSMVDVTLFFMEFMIYLGISYSFFFKFIVSSRIEPHFVFEFGSFDIMLLNSVIFSKV